VEEADIVAAMGFCFSRLKVVVEPSGAVPLAALLAGVVPGDGRRIAVVLSGGNIAPADFAALLDQGRLQAAAPAG
jgi:threonine dehydratase